MSWEIRGTTPSTARVKAMSEDVGDKIPAHRPIDQKLDRTFAQRSQPSTRAVKDSGTHHYQQKTWSNLIARIYNFFSDRSFLRQRKGEIRTLLHQNSQLYVQIDQTQKALDEKAAKLESLKRRFSGKHLDSADRASIELMRTVTLTKAHQTSLTGALKDLQRTVRSNERKIAKASEEIARLQIDKKLGPLVSELERAHSKLKSLADKKEQLSLQSKIGNPFAPRNAKVERRQQRIERQLETTRSNIDKSETNLRKLRDQFAEPLDFERRMDAPLV